MLEGHGVGWQAVASPARRSPVLLALVAALALGGWSAAPAGAAPARPAAAVTAPASGACSDPSGVTVVVDFGAFGGGVAVRCAGWPVADGYDALRRAGFTVTDTSRFPGLLCKIDGLPSDQACVAAPPPDAHWGYSHAERGGSWTYSSQGARARDVQPGDVEGWAFGEAARPSIAPPAPAPTTTTAPPAPVSPAPSAPVPAAPAPDPAGPPPAPPSAAATAEPADDESGGDDGVAGGPSASSSEDGGGGATDATDDEARPDGDDRLAAGPNDTRLAGSAQPASSGSGSPLPAVATAAALAALVGGGVAIRRRRGAGA